MILTLTRIKMTPGVTLGALYLDTEFACWTLEDPVRPPGEKIPGNTAIPYGHYDIHLRPEGGMHVRYAQRFPQMHRGMLWLQNVPNFEWVYMHIGNTVRDTEGCILVGLHVYDALGSQIAYSESAYTRIYPRIAEAIEREWEPVRIEIRKAI